MSRQVTNVKPGTAWLASMFCAILLAVVVGGCGGSSSSAQTETASTGAAATKSASDAADVTGSKADPESGPTKSRQESASTANLKVSIPAGLTSTNTCKGKNSSPEIAWSKVPAGTKELAVFAVNVQPVKGKLYFDWALAGIDPRVTHLRASEVPTGAVRGRTSSGAKGWSLCPRNSKSETYIFSVYALSKALSPQEGFDPLKLRVKVTPVTKKVGLEGVTFAG
jgi:phosphatidylethanolamine-binding protein (PEBP) family uncharacterized protein